MTSARIAAALLLVLGVSGCAAWEDHNENTKESRSDFEAGRFDAALKSLEGGVNNELDGLCYQLDRGLIAQVGGMYQLSMKEFEHAEGTITKFEDRGLTGAGAAQQIGAFAVNEKTIPYEGEDFEKILVPVFNSRNYLLEHQLEDAMVEVRKIWYQQKICKQLHEKELAETDKKAKEEKVDTKSLGDIDGKIEYPAEALKSPESIYEITFAHYISALISERMGEWNDAYISMKDTAKIRPDLPFVQRDLVRFAKALGMSEDVQEYKSKYPNVSAPGKDDGSVALLFDCGWAPHKEELKFAVPGYKTFAAVAVPIYKRTPDPGAHARLVLRGKGNAQEYETRILTDLEAIAFKYHRAKMPMIIIRQIIRTTLKAAAGSGAAYGTEKAVGGEAGALAGLGVGLASGIYNYASEQADLRAWLTLPRNFQAVRVWVPAGSYDAKVELVGAQGQVLNTIDLGQLNVKPGSLRFAFARSLGTSLFGKLLAERADKEPKLAKKKPAETTTDLRTPDAPVKKKPAEEKTASSNQRVPDAEKPASAPVEKSKTDDEQVPADEQKAPAAEKTKKADESPAADAPKDAAPVTDAPKDAAPATDAPKDAPPADAPKADKSDKGGEGAGDAPKADKSDKGGDGAGDAPKADKSDKGGEGAGDAPKADKSEKPKDGEKGEKGESGGGD